MNHQFNNWERRATELLGTTRRATRVRGFAPWKPREETKPLLTQINAVLNEYVSYLPLTIRQVFYRLVGAHGYSKTEASYERLGEVLNRARRARLVPMEAIRDDGGLTAGGTGWESVDDFLASIRKQAEYFRLDRTAGQKTRLAVFCEAAGMVPQLETVCDRFDIKVVSSGGYESVTEKHRVAFELASDRPTEVLHIGDLDPSGLHLFLAFAEDVEAFTHELGSGEISFARLAVTPEQVARLGLETAPPKATDRRAFRGETCQAEAIAPDVLAQILRDAITARIDQRMLQAVIRREQQARRELLTKFDSGGAP